jgi:formylglycine-generating enzyme required for sulfatase activity
MANPFSFDARIPCRTNDFSVWKMGMRSNPRLFLKVTIFFWILSLFATGCQKQDPASKTPVFTNSIDMRFVYIPSGRFQMGSQKTEEKRHPDETRHDVTLTRGFFMGITEVTQAQWQTVMGGNPSEFKTCGKDCPVESVSWHDAQAFIDRLNRLEKTDRYRLPTEAEWEYACRSGNTRPFSFGECLPTDRANFDGRQPFSDCPRGGYREMTVPVAGFPANPFGIHDMHGNVWEWCQDWYGRFSNEPATDPTGPASGKYRIVRGGSWFSVDHDCRSANRDRSAPHLTINTIGFRLVKAP